MASDLHTHGRDDVRPDHWECQLAGWRCTRCGHDHEQDPRACHRCAYTVLAPLWLALADSLTSKEPTP